MSDSPTPQAPAALSNLGPFVRVTLEIQARSGAEILSDKYTWSDNLPLGFPEVAGNENVAIVLASRAIGEATAAMVIRHYAGESA